MTKDEAKDLVVGFVLSKQGCKKIDIEWHWCFINNDCDLFELIIKELVEEKRIVEVSYMLPYSEPLEKHLYFPGKTQISVRE